MRLPISAIHAIAAALLAVAVQAPQPPTPPTAMVVGHVVDGVTGAPVSGAEVEMRLLPPSNAPPPSPASPRPPGLSRVLVDDTGGFVLNELAAGSYSLTTNRRGYATGAYGKTRPDGNSIDLTIADGQRLRDVTLRIWKYGSISGTLLDEAGDPLVGVAVEALRRDWRAGHPQLIESTSAMTDDRGMYRLGSLVAGDYIVAITATQTTVPADLARATGVPGDPGSRDAVRIGDVLLQNDGRSIVTPGPSADGRLMVYPATYYPSASAAPGNPVVTVTAGEHKSVPPLQLRPAASVRITGTLTGPSGPAANIPLSLVPQSADDLSSELGFEAAEARTDARGRFTFLGVIPGQYRLRARKGSVAPPKPNAPPDPLLWIAESVAVGTQDLTLDLSLKMGFEVTVRFAFEGQKPRPTVDQMGRVQVQMDQADGRRLSNPATIIVTTQDEAATLRGVAAGRYSLHVSGPPSGWTVKAATLHGADILDVPIDVSEDLPDLVVTFTDRPAVIQGSLRTSAGDADLSAIVVLFPANPQRWVDYGSVPARIRSTRPDANGAFSLIGVPPGDYLIAAIADESSSAWRTPMFKDALSRQAMRIHVDDGATMTVALKRTEGK